jgi:hypothetical protein
MVEQGRPPEDTLVGFADNYLTSITAGNVREYEYPIVKDNDPPDDPAHGLVLGKKTNKFANAMVLAHQWIVGPPKK